MPYLSLVLEQITIDLVNLLMDCLAAPLELPAKLGSLATLSGHSHSEATWGRSGTLVLASSREGPGGGASFSLGAIPNSRLIFCGIKEGVMWVRE
jgi:hypothetical protein